MKKTALAVLLLGALLLCGCVSRGEYDALLRERDRWKESAEALEQELGSLRDDVAELPDYVRQLHEENDGLREALVEAKKEGEKQRKELGELAALVEELKKQTAPSLPALPDLIPSAPELPRIPADGGARQAIEAIEGLLQRFGIPLPKT